MVYHLEEHVIALGSSYVLVFARSSSEAACFHSLKESPSPRPRAEAVDIILSLVWTYVVNKCVYTC